MKLFKSANVSLINDSRLFLKFLLPSEILEKENKNFSITYYFNLNVDWYAIGLMFVTTDKFNYACW